jgi:hypothetical protein
MAIIESLTREQEADDCKVAILSPLWDHELHDGRGGSRGGGRGAVNVDVEVGGFGGPLCDEDWRGGGDRKRGGGPSKVAEIMDRAEGRGN